MQKKYNHSDVEAKWYQTWQERKVFSQHNLKQEPFTILLPPPNITGQLHLGHALNGYFQDILARYYRFHNRDVLYLPAIDHAGISAQVRAEKELAKQNKSRLELGKKRFLKFMETWKEDHKKIIFAQWSKLGLALDYDKFRYTKDEAMSTLVNDVFVNMYNDGLIYRGPRAIFWDVAHKTAISNIEIEYKNEQSKMVYIKYAIANSKDHVLIATTRPETIFSDVAVVLNPQDPRLKELKNKQIINPLNGKLMPVISDSYVDPKFGTGIMKCSAHAEEDIRMIRANKLELIECIGLDGNMNKHALSLEGSDRFEAREKVIEILKKQNQVEKIETITNRVGYSQRSQTVIEIIYSTQWFVKMEKLSQMVLKNLASKESVEFIPSRFKQVIKRWMENVYDWTISRQLWWGHPIPAWHKNGEVKVQIKSPGQGWIQDESVLDTWFSSGLAPFGFMKSEADLERYFPCSLLVTAYDIIFFWVARMYFQSLYVHKQIPFKQCILHGLVRDEQGRKMSKSLGNGIDPIKVIDQYGSDALRWFLTTKATLGQDISFSIKDVAHGWNIINKIWNTGRFIIHDMKKVNQESPLDPWIKNKFNQLQSKIEIDMKKTNFTVIAKNIQEFVFDTFSSGYIEMSKEVPNHKLAQDIFSKLLILLHPFLPFATEELYSKMHDSLIVNASWPKPFTVDKKNQIINFDEVLNIINFVRKTRHELAIPSSEITKLFWEKNGNEDAAKVITKMTKSEFVTSKSQHKWITLTVGKSLPLSIEILPSTQQRQLQRLQKSAKQLEGEVKRSKNILNNQKFMSKAPQAKIDIEKQKAQDYQAQLELVLKQITEWS